MDPPPNAHSIQYSVLSTHFLLRLFGHQLMVARNEKLMSAFLILLKVYVLVVCFQISKREMETVTKRQSLE